MLNWQLFQPRNLLIIGLVALAAVIVFQRVAALVNGSDASKS